MYRQTYKEDVCRGCGDEKLIVYVSGKLCIDCNQDRKRANQKPPKQASVKEHTYKRGVCEGCSEDKLIVFVSGQLCFGCNNERRQAKQERSIKPISARGLVTIKEDEKVYEMVWNTRPHRCEECGCALGDRFRDDDGRVIARFRYSHILTKGAHPELRHNLLNFNLLCLPHHQEWETGKRKEMKIYKKNEVVINKLLLISRTQ